jgi:hypothetical protein
VSGCRKAGCINIQIYKSGHTFISTKQQKCRYKILLHRILHFK